MSSATTRLLPRWASWPLAAGPVSLGGNAVPIDADQFHTCAILTNGSVRCWGYNIHGQLGTGNSNNVGDNELPSSVPVVQFY